jgi:hypothetical protein
VVDFDATGVAVTVDVAAAICCRVPVLGIVEKIKRY